MDAELKKAIDTNKFPADGMAKLIANSDGRSESGHIRGQVSNLNKSLNNIDSATKAVLDANYKLINQCDELSKQSKQAISRAKDQANQMQDAMNKITKCLGRDFEGRIEQLETLTDCLERLNKLRESGAIKELSILLSK